MRQILAVLLLALTIPSTGWAQKAHEKLLPAGSQIYFNWDGMKSHQAAADKLAVMKMWKGDTGKFIKTVWQYIEEQGRTALSAELNPALATSVFENLGGAFTTVSNHGFAVGIEVQSIDPPDLQATIVFPNGAAEKKSPLAFLKTMSQVDPNAPIKNLQQGNRSIQYVEAAPIFVSWWGEGNDAVISIGTSDPMSLLKEIGNQQFSIANEPLYKELQQFKEFPVWFRGYVNLPSLARVAGRINPAVGQILDVLGLRSIKSVTVFSGFDGPAERAVVFTNLQGPAKGIFKIAGNTSFSLKDLPPMPPDLSGFSAGSMNPKAAYDLGIDLGDTLIRIFDPFGNQSVRQMIKDFENANNISISGVFDELGDLYVSYAAAPEGFLGFGQIQLIKVKNEKKLEQELTNILQKASNQLFGILALNTTKYHGANLHVVSFNDPQGTPLSTFCFTIHKGWLGFSTFPQPLKGYILRANGELPTWEASAELRQRLASFPKEFTGIVVSDPRPGIQFVLSILPPVIQIGQNALRQAVPGGIPLRPFDITLIPNAYEATQHLFPNITITTREKNRIRAETRASLAFPF